MGYVVRMPKLGMSMEEGTVVEWAVEEGATVEEEDLIAVVESEKASADVDAREDGVLRRTFVEEGSIVPIGTPLGIVAERDEDLGPYVATVENDIGEGIDAEIDVSAGLQHADRQGRETGEIAEAASTRGGGDVDETRHVESEARADEVQASPGARKLADEGGVDLGVIDGSGPEGVVTEDDVRAVTAGEPGTDVVADLDEATDVTVRASPGARRLAAEADVDLSSVPGTGPEGVITEADVVAHIGDGTAGKATRTVAENRELSGVQRTIADRLGESYREAVHVTLHRSFDTSTLRATIAAANSNGVDASVTDLLVRSVGESLLDHPEFNALFENGVHQLVEEVHVGVAVDYGQGLVTPVISAVTERSVESVADRRRLLTERVLAGEFTADDLAGGTFTVSNLGPFGVDSFDPIVNPPEVAILGIGRIGDDDAMTLSLSFDHRVVNGADAAKFLESIVHLVTDNAALTALFETDLDAGDEASEHAVTVENPPGYRGAYHARGETVGFDEPEAIGGSGSAPNPIEHLLGALGSCLALSVRAIATRDDIEVGKIEVTVEATPDHGPPETIDVLLDIDTDASVSDVDRMLPKAERACYVARSLSDDLAVSLAWERT